MKTSIIKNSLIATLGLITFTATLLITTPDKVDTSIEQQTYPEISKTIVGSPEGIDIPVNHSNIDTPTPEPEMKYIPKPKPIEKPKPVIKPEIIKEPIKEEKSEPIKTEKKKEVKQQPERKTEEKKNPDKVDVNDSRTPFEIGKDITKSECNSNLWINSKSEAHNGTTWFQYEGNNESGKILLSLEVKPSLQGRAEKIEHVVWHECGHAVQFNLSEENWEYIKKEGNRLFNCKSNLECLTDAMATVKTNTTVHNWYQKGFNNEQLELARKVWDMNDQAEKEKNITSNHYDNITNLF